MSRLLLRGGVSRVTLLCCRCCRVVLCCVVWSLLRLWSSRRPIPPCSVRPCPIASGVCGGRSFVCTFISGTGESTCCIYCVMCEALRSIRNRQAWGR
ncbi:uncharacterized protein C8Q71DRAFT_233266 [Rhodofomes roseus]|uniref:Secreted protein n=1 Tax=Rhodofomes roseus TaxID=34475 RepID=A0ABQ8KVE7_9APHY|nr:uncharacterized protein C8Q71DRAFT_233266 [Rhodofomes roseus]KAH9843052.1 hypothetical protein C8Q71DRAFT_233266 [Rhodofomes roseus]